MTDETDLYVISHPDMYHKIGVADDPEQRLGMLQVGSPYELTLEATVRAVNDGGTTVEEEIHHYYQTLHKRGEWYSIVGEVEGFRQLDVIRASNARRVRKERRWRGEPGRTFKEELEIARRSTELEYGDPHHREGVL